jgi:4-diphosphocytidyl-2-C-methyl-D-erythritol kinase
MPTTVRSHAKINLGLYIGVPRPDGFHSLVTVYQTLELHDLVTVAARSATQTSIRITSNDTRVPTDNRNTAWKAVELALQDGGTYADVEIHIEKRLPVQGGLGAGSANAVAALIGLEKELGILDELHPGPNDQLAQRRCKEQRLEIAAQVGSDVPLFLIGGTVLGLDRGQEVYPLPDIDPTWCVIAIPSIGVSTPQAFRDWDALCAAQGLTPDASTGKLNELSRAYASAFSGAKHAGSSGVPALGGDLAGSQESALVRTGITSWIENDFERVVFAQHPSLADIKRLLAGPDKPEAAGHASSLLASLSGSGSALFGLYLTREDAQAAQDRLTAAGVESQITRTLPRSEYWESMIVE